MMNSRTLQHAVVILAAGASSRLGKPKQLVQLNGESLINHTVRVALETIPAQTLLVLGHDADVIYSTIKYQPVERIDCADWQQGMSASLKAGVQRVHDECEGALILLCDQPSLNASHLRAMLNTWRQHPAHAVASAYADTVGVPALLPRNWFHRVDHIAGDQGARELLRGDASIIRIKAPELAHDVDSARDLPGNYA